MGLGWPWRLGLMAIAVVAVVFVARPRPEADRRVENARIVDDPPAGDDVAGDNAGGNDPAPRIDEGDTASRSAQGQVSGVVLDPGGLPIVGARVRICCQKNAPRARTDERGRFTLDAPSNPVSLDVVASGYIDGWAAAVPGDVEITLEPAATIDGRVLERKTRRPVAGAKVRGSTDHLNGNYPVLERRTAEDGTFRYRKVRGGRTRLFASTQHLAGTAYGAIDLAPGQHANVEILLDPAFVLEGTVVVSGEPGAPCPSGRLTAGEWSSSAQTASISAGMVRVGGLAPGEYPITLSCDGYAARAHYPPVVISDRDRKGLRWEVDRGCALDVLVLGSKGEARAGVAVDGFQQTMLGGRRVLGGVTDERGRITLTGVPVHGYSVALGDATTETTIPLHSPCTQGELIVHLADTVELHGRVIDLQGRAVAGVEIRVAQPHHSVHAWTSADGTFRAKGLQIGGARLQVKSGVSAAYYRIHGTEGSVLRFSVDADRRTDLEVVVVAPSGAIRGLVTDASGSPEQDVTVVALSKRQEILAQTRPGPGGRFALLDLEPHPYRVCARRASHQEVCKASVEPGTEIELRVPDAASVEGLVVGSPAEIGSFKIEIERAHDWDWGGQQFTGTNGKWRLEGLNPGRQLISASTPSSRGSVEVVLKEGELRQGVVIRLDGRGVITGRVVRAEDGAPLRATVRAEEREHTTDPEGRFRIDARPGPTLLSIGVALDAEPRCVLWRRVSVPPRGEVDLGAVLLPRNPRSERSGDLGFWLEGETGPLRADVDDEGPARTAGLRDGDPIVSINGRAVSGDESLENCLLRAMPGETVTIGLGDGTRLRVTAQE